jgi:hypothetical protein
LRYRPRKPARIPRILIDIAGNRANRDMGAKPPPLLALPEREAPASQFGVRKSAKAGTVSASIEAEPAVTPAI